MDYARPVRRAILPALKADPGVVALIPAASIYPATVPDSRTFPFIRYGATTINPFRLSGLNSSSVRPTINAFAKPLYAGGVPTGSLLDSAESQAEKMAAAIKAALDGRVLEIEGGMKATISWLATTLRQDPTEKDGWHAAVAFLAEIAG